MATGRTRVISAAAVALAGTAPFVLPLLMLNSSIDDPYQCGDLGSLGTLIFGTLIGAVMFGGVTATAAAVLRRPSVLLVIPAFLLLGYAALATSALAVAVPPCDEGLSGLGLLLALAAGGVTYALGRGSVTTTPASPPRP